MNFKKILGAVGWNQTAIVDLCALEGARSLTARIGFQNKRVCTDAFANYTLIKELAIMQRGSS
jgi:hypothetical protein